jgi:hypothetical protein
MFFYNEKLLPIIEENRIRYNLCKEFKKNKKLLASYVTTPDKCYDKSSAILTYFPLEKHLCTNDCEENKERTIPNEIEYLMFNMRTPIEMAEVSNKLLAYNATLDIKTQYNKIKLIIESINWLNYWATEQYWVECTCLSEEYYEHNHLNY